MDKILQLHSKQLIIIGGGAAGFFAALTAARLHPQYKVTILEKTSKLLSKVKISGGGRCNVTHACYSVSELVKNYPRGGKFLKKVFPNFTPQHTFEWFAERGVQLKTEEDGRVFPTTDDSQTIIDCFFKEAKNLNIDIKINQEVRYIQSNLDGTFLLTLPQSENIKADKVIIATGGGAKMKHFEWFASLNHEIISPVPSLFTFNMPKQALTQLMGVVASPVLAKIQSSKLSQEGALLITHWGMSGPAILKLSAWGARLLQEMEYSFQVQVNWITPQNEEQIRQTLLDFKENSPQKKIKNFPLTLPKRLWSFLLEKAAIQEDTELQALPKNALNRLANLLTADVYPVKGKTTFKEEFVTSGGVALEQINPQTMESKLIPNLYFAGEVLDIDGVTGGFNFQAAWATAFVAGKAVGL